MNIGKINNFFVVIFIILGLAACGGDVDKPETQGKSKLLRNAAEPIVVRKELLISEISANYRRKKGATWIEIFNNSENTINLIDYKLRSGGLDINKYLGDLDPVSPQPVIFDLPDITIPPGGYFVLAGKMYAGLTNTTQASITADKTGHAYITDATGVYVPYWTDANGFVEMLDAKLTKTVDFVRFGTEITDPITKKFWNNGSLDLNGEIDIIQNVAAFPAVDSYEVSFSFDPLDDYSASIVRLSKTLTTSNTKTDWTFVGFPTPGGKNDVDGSANDSDRDGIPDSAKIAGGTFSGLDLYRMGARPGQRDLFIHVDYMLNPQDPGVDLQKAALLNVVNAFQANRHNISVHFDVGNKFTRNFNRANYNLSEKNHNVELSSCTQLRSPIADRNYGIGDLDVDCKNLYTYSSSLDSRRKPVFRYLLMSYRDRVGGSAASGTAELPGNKFQVTLGDHIGFVGNSNGRNARINLQASTIMHELGHTLGLRHGGDVNNNRKPNYFSVMNYLYQLNGLPTSATGAGVNQRYYHAVNNYDYNANIMVDANQDADRNAFGQFVRNYSVPGFPNKSTYGVCDVPEGPCSTPAMKIDYSNGLGQSLNEAALLEANYIGRGVDPGIFGDWNYDEIFDQIETKHYLSENTLQGIITDHNDWAALRLVIGRKYQDMAIKGRARRLARPDDEVKLIIGAIAKEELLITRPLQ